MGDAARRLDTERDYRKQVRRAYYKREEDFETLRDYNDYLEEVEDIVEALLCEETRVAGRAQLDALRVASSETTARNRAKLEAEKRALTDRIASQAHEAQQRAEDRQADQHAAVAQQRTQQREMQDQIAEGRTSVATAQAELALRRAEGAAHAAPASAVKAEQQPAGYQYTPSAQGRGGGGASLLAQPLEPQAEGKQAKFMQPSRLAPTEEYERDPAKLCEVRQAGGYRAELWQYRYREEAFDVSGLTQCLTQAIDAGLQSSQVSSQAAQCR